MTVATSNAFAQTDFIKIEGGEIKNNPISQEILNKIEISKKQFEQIKEIEIKKNQQQKFIDEQRILANQSLRQELDRMEKKYEEFTPRNAFAAYISGLNSTHHKIFWNQFDYLHAKVTLAKEARDSVLKQGGTYTDAMKQYVKYAKMPKIEMLNFIRELNLEYNFAQESIQSNFDMSGKLPRYENDLEAPCYGCTEKISKVKISSEQTAPIQLINFESKPIKVNELRDGLSQLQKKFLESKNIIAQKKIVLEMNEIVKQIQEIE
jgi:hypothetical protein